VVTRCTQVTCSNFESFGRRSTGVAVLLLSGRVQPSCRPDAETHRIGHKVVIRAIKNIKTGAEITYNYGRDYLINVITRRGCKCDKCRKKRAAARAKARAKSRTSPAKPKKMGKKKCGQRLSAKTGSRFTIRRPFYLEHS
jgi:hypothetical protein